MAAISRAIIVAGGHSTRMNGIDKTFEDLAGKPLIAHTIEAFQRSDAVSGIVLVLPRRNLERGAELRELYGFSKIDEICEGGATRQESVSNGVEKLLRCDIVLVHDGARPLVSQETIETGISMALRYNIAVPVAPLHDTIKKVDGAGFITATLDRSTIFAARTPQVFRYLMLKSLHRKAPPGSATDDSSLAEKAGYAVFTYPDKPENIKVTTPFELAIVRTVLAQPQAD